jgi:hypothetical protein
MLSTLFGWIPKFWTLQDDNCNDDNLKKDDHEISEKIVEQNETKESIIDKVEQSILEIEKLNSLEHNLIQDPCPKQEEKEIDISPSKYNLRKRKRIDYSPSKPHVKRKRIVSPKKKNTF